MKIGSREAKLEEHLHGQGGSGKYAVDTKPRKWYNH
jgi:hypothetical protein